MSTDKAVKPSSVMGATKRLAEIIVTSFATLGATRFMAVRFGNVLGGAADLPGAVAARRAEDGERSRGEALLHDGGGGGEPHLAVSLSRGGEIFVLKMGEAVRIVDMAKSLIRLSGLEPGKDVEIRFTGLRQGEKMDEELMEDPAGCSPSEHSQILILRGENAALADRHARF